jgi:hypothetical protein
MLDITIDCYMSPSSVVRPSAGRAPLLWQAACSGHSIRNLPRMLPGSFA